MLIVQSRLCSIVAPPNNVAVEPSQMRACVSCSRGEASGANTVM